MGELQATIEVSVEFHNFHNVDLFQRGFYQIRSHMKTSSKLPGKLEVRLPKNKPSQEAFPLCIINGTAVSRTFQILYRSEEIGLDDIVHFRWHAIVEGTKIEETLEHANLQLVVELWYSERGAVCPSSDGLVGVGYSSKGMECVSSRTLDLVFSPTRGLHHHRPVLFDYFHLSAVSLTVHAALTSIHQPYINSPRSASSSTKFKLYFGMGKFQNGSVKPAVQQRSSTEIPFFGSSSSKVGRLDAGVGLDAARRMHREICGVLVPALESLRSSLVEYSQLLTGKCSSEATRGQTVSDYENRLSNLSGMTKGVDCEDEFLAVANSNVSQLCGELVMLWSVFLNTVHGKSRVAKHLAKVHHFRRIQRFSEGFFSIRHPRKDALSCVESTYSVYASVSEKLRCSKCFSTMEKLPVSCPDLDGDVSSLPVIFEDVYHEDVRPSVKSDKLRLNKGPRPASVPSSKKFVDEDTVSCSGVIELPRHRHANREDRKPRSIVSRFLSQEVEHLNDGVKVVPNVLDVGDEPNVLTSKSVKSIAATDRKVPLRIRVKSDGIARDLRKRMSHPGESNGFSYLEWSPNVPYNLAEEPDDPPGVGMTHSYSCQSMPSIVLPMNLTEKEAARRKPFLTNIKEFNVKSCEDEEQVPIADQQQLSRKMEEFRRSSRPVSRPRARSEEVSSIDLPPKSDSQDDDLFKLNGPELMRKWQRNSLPLPPIQFRDSPEQSYGRRRDCREVPNEVFGGVKNVATAGRRSVTMSFVGGSSSSSSTEAKQEKTVESSPGGKEVSRGGTMTTTKSNIDNDDGNIHSSVSAKWLSAESAGWMEGFSTSPQMSDLRCDHECVLSSGEKSLQTALNDDCRSTAFIEAKEEFKKSISIDGILFYSDMLPRSVFPYFHSNGGIRGPFKGVHLIVCVHGLDGNSADMRLVKTYLEMALSDDVDFLMSEGNQADTFLSFEEMTEKLVEEILLFLDSNYNVLPSRISFVGHSLGCILIRSAITRPRLAFLVSKFHTFLSLSGPHLGTLYNNSGLVNMGLWFMQKWKKSCSLQQLALKDATDIRKTFLYRLALRSNLHMFANVLLAGSTQDRYVPWHSARIEMCKSSTKDGSLTGSAYGEMVHNIISPIANRPEVRLVRYDIHHALPSNTNALIGRAAHIAVLDSELFIEKFLVVAALKYFE